MAKRLTDVQIRTAKARPRAYKISAGSGLWLLVTPKGAKYFRFRFRYAGKEKSISLGVYPQVSLKEAEAKAHDARALLRDGINPSDDRREKKLALRYSEARTFGHAANLWLEHNKPRWRPATLEKVTQYLDKDLLPPLGSRPLSKIIPLELGQVVQKIEGRQALNVAKKTRQWLNAIFSYAIAKGLTTTNPAQYLSTVAMHLPEAKNHAHLQLSELPSLLRALDAYDGSMLTKACAWLALWTANRPGVTRSVKWSELDLKHGLWTIPKGREGMKRGYQHVTPLPTQAVALLETVRPLTATFEYVFVGRNDPRKPLSDGAVAGMLKAMGYGGRQTLHGFRHLVSTALNEKGFEADWIERQLAHGDPDDIRGTYNKAMYLPQRKQMMQAWADLLDQMKAGTAAP